MKEILNTGKEFPCRRRSPIVVYAAGYEYVGYLPPDLSFACSNGTNTLEKFAEIVLTECLFPLFQSLVIKSKPLDDVFLENIRCPDAKASRFCAVDSVTNRNDSIKIVVLGVVFFPIGGSY